MKSGGGSVDIFMPKTPEEEERKEKLLEIFHDIPTAKVKYQWSTPPKIRYGVGRFTPDGAKFIFAAGNDKEGTWDVIDLATGESVLKFVNAKRPAKLAVHPDGRTVAAGTRSSGDSNLAIQSSRDRTGNRRARPDDRPLGYENMAADQAERKKRREAAPEILLRDFMPIPVEAYVAHDGERRWETFESAQEKHENSLYAHASSRYVFRLLRAKGLELFSIFLLKANIPSTACRSTGPFRLGA